MLRVVNVMATTLDGLVASHGREADAERMALGFHSAVDQRHLRQQINSAQAIVIGARTLRAAGGVLPARSGVDLYVVGRRMPGRHSAFWREADRRRWLVGPLAQGLKVHDAGVRLLRTGQRPWPVVLRRHLLARGLTRVLLLGGATINREAYQYGLVDELMLTLFPLILAPLKGVPLVAPRLPHPASLQLTALRRRGSLVFLNYKVCKF